MRVGQNLLMSGTDPLGGTTGTSVVSQRSESRTDKEDWVPKSVEVSMISGGMIGWLSRFVVVYVGRTLLDRTPRHVMSRHNDK
jgi:hypothetical protein